MTLNTDFMRIADETNREERQYTVMISSSVYVYPSLLDKIIMYMSQGNSIKHADAVTITGKSYRTVKRYLQILKEAGIVEYIGNNRSGRWELVVPKD